MTNFDLKEKQAYWKKKWRREHIGLLIALALVALAFLVVPPLAGKPWLSGLCPVVVLIEYAWQNNRMMIYVEKNLYD